MRNNLRKQNKITKKNQKCQEKINQIFLIEFTNGMM